MFPIGSHGGGFFFSKNILIKCMKTCVCHQTMNVYCGQAAQKEELLNMGLLIADSDVAIQSYSDSA